MAISSKDLKNDTSVPTTEITSGANKNKKRQKSTNNNDKDTAEARQRGARKLKPIGNNVVSRLARAAKEAAAAKKRKKKTKNYAEKNYASSNLRRENDHKVVDDDLYFDNDDTMFDNGGVQDEEEHHDLSSITNLNKVIDEELLRHPDGYKPSRETDSIRILLEHNNNQDRNNGRTGTTLQKKSIISSSSPSKSSSSKLRKKKDSNLIHNDVAIVFARPLVEGQLTIEYAVRLVSLAKAMKFEGYKPSLICFCSPASANGASTLSSQSTIRSASKSKSDGVTSMGFEFFRQLCVANEISLDGTSLCPIPNASSQSISRSIDQQYDSDDPNDTYRSTFSTQHTSTSSFRSSWSPFSLSPIVKKLLDKKYLEKWLEESQDYESDMDEYGMTRQEPRKKIHIHWKLFSTEYDLCNLNDIHIRSPRQSPLARLVHDLEHAANSEHYRRGIIRTTWSYHYSIYPYVVSSNTEKMKEAFLGKCYLMAQALLPLLVNLKGVADNSEFFQRDNYRTLVATRRSLATLLEEMNEAYRDNRERQAASIVIPPTLKAQLKKQTSESSATISSIEIHLECALLSLGRCCDLVRPAGTFSEQSVSRQGWKDALLHLQDFMVRIEGNCDPDRPVSADQWGGKIIENRSVIELLS
ncbi:unnamed protein product [Pseudo-nitzschia multistriata]|uniref:Uncharacterized protein n=1 Tax=Pseudo-nitzschia multistriata TaxID=183589 RepID=A0A448Z5W7_9STRA|nr:unnamed protein product [Pseudo-nitzschia multistriata]